MRAGEVTAEKVGAVERELEEAEVAFAEREQKHEALLVTVAADLEVGAISPGDAASQTHASEEALDLARTRIERLRRAAPELRVRLAARQAEQEERERRAEAAKLARACEAASKSAEKLAKILAEADRAARDVVSRRAEVDLTASTAGAPTNDASVPVGRRRSQTTLLGGHRPNTARRLVGRA